MEKGVIFTYDAMLALGVIAVLLSTVSLAGNAGSLEAGINSAKYMKVTDKAIIGYYTGNTDVDVPDGNNVVCSEILELRGDSVFRKLRACR